MPRLELLKQKISSLYLIKKEGRADWADWLFEHHIFVVAEYAKNLSARFGGHEELAVAASLLHDVADAVMSRFDERHENESLQLARVLLTESGFSTEEISLVVDDAIRFHSCFNGSAPLSLEGKIMATADALAHLKTDFYKYAISRMKTAKSEEEIKAWGLKKIDRDFNDKIQFEEIRADVRSDYERLNTMFINL